MLMDGQKIVAVFIVFGLVAGVVYISSKKTSSSGLRPMIAPPAKTAKTEKPARLPSLKPAPQLGKTPPSGST